jgi:hypothetical protein
METFMDKLVTGSVGWLVGVIMGILLVHFWPSLRVWLAGKISKT